MTITTQTIELHFWRLHRHDQLGDLRLISFKRYDEGFTTVQIGMWAVTWTWLSDTAEAFG